MRQRGVVCGVLVLLLAAPAGAQEGDGTGGGSTIRLSDQVVRVRWSDGDSFRFLDGEHEGRGVRLGGYNALESYGPVHQWGTWTGQQLYELSQQAKDFARAGSWNCTTNGQVDRYDRLLVECADLTTAMAAAGLGLLVVFDPVGHPATSEALAAQREAQQEGRGMWAGGVPSAIVTSLHSADENEGSGQANIYNRIVYTDSGLTEELGHQDTYAVCQLVCLEAQGSCMVYVPFEQRYGDGRAECLRASYHPSE